MGNFNDPGLNPIFEHEVTEIEDEFAIREMEKRVFERLHVVVNVRHNSDFHRANVAPMPSGSQIDLGILSSFRATVHGRGASFDDAE